MKIENCPFCGNNNLSIGTSLENKTYEVYSFLHHCTSGIIISSPWKKTKEELIDMWNKRTHS